MNELYNLHTSDSEYRITKFLDGNVAASYTLTETSCSCPAGVRQTCRHRQMLPHMLISGILNTHWFFNRNLGCACDINGDATTHFDRAAQDTTPAPAEPAPMPEGLHVEGMSQQQSHTFVYTTNEPPMPITHVDLFVDAPNEPVKLDLPQPIITLPWRRI